MYKGSQACRKPSVTYVLKLDKKTTVNDGCHRTGVYQFWISWLTRHEDNALTRPFRPFLACSGSLASNSRVAGRRVYRPSMPSLQTIKKRQYFKDYIWYPRWTDPLMKEGHLPFAFSRHCHNNTNKSLLGRGAESADMCTSHIHQDLSKVPKSSLVHWLIG